MTCFRFKERWYYICVILDLFSCKVVAYGISPNNSTRLFTATFPRAMAERSPGAGLLFHSDQGTQYTAYAFRKLLVAHGVTQSFSKAGTPHDNAVAESFFATFKKEELYRTNCHSQGELRKRIESYIMFYNDSRAHTTLHYKTPPRRKPTIGREQRKHSRNAGFGMGVFGVFHLEIKKTALRHFRQ